MKAWIEHDPDYNEYTSYLEVEEYGSDGMFLYGIYQNHRPLPWKIEYDYNSILKDI